MDRFARAARVTKNAAKISACVSVTTFTGWSKRIVSISRPRGPHVIRKAFANQNLQGSAGRVKASN